jgi:hypothetical protein
MSIDNNDKATSINNNLGNPQQMTGQLQDEGNNPPAQENLSTGSDINKAISQLAQAHLDYIEQSGVINTTGNTDIDLTRASKAAAELQEILNNPPVYKVFTSDEVNAANNAIANANALTSSSNHSDIEASFQALATAQLPYAQAAATNLQIILSAFDTGVTINSSNGQSNTISSIHAGSSVDIFNGNISFNVPDQVVFSTAKVDIATVTALNAKSSLSEIQSAMTAVTVDHIPFIQSTSIILQCIISNPSETTPEQCQEASKVLSAVQALTTGSSVAEINQVCARLLGFMTQFSAS